MVLTASTNTQLINFAEKMKLPLNNILMRDEMNELKNDGFYIINLDDSKWQWHSLDCTLFSSFK